MIKHFTDEIHELEKECIITNINNINEQKPKIEDIEHQILEEIMGLCGKLNAIPEPRPRRWK